MSLSKTLTKFNWESSSSEENDYLSRYIEQEMFWQTAWRLLSIQRWCKHRKECLEYREHLIILHLINFTTFSLSLLVIFRIYIFLELNSIHLSACIEKIWSCANSLMFFVSKNWDNTLKHRIYYLTGGVKNEWAKILKFFLFIMMEC